MTPQELEAAADALLADSLEEGESLRDVGILTADAERGIVRREIYTASGVAHIPVPGMFRRARSAEK